MLVAETELLKAVRTVLQAVTFADPHYVNVEIDEKAPATAGQKYIAIQAGGTTNGKYHNPSGGVNDHLYAVDVTVAKRLTNVPRDRERDAFIFHTESLNVICEAVKTALDFRYDVLTVVNTALALLQPTQPGFFHPLVFAGIDPKPRIVTGDFFGADDEEPRAGLARKLTFNLANRITYRTGT